MIFQGDSPLFSFDGKHCEQFGVAFIPSQYPFLRAQTIPGMTLDSRHGSLRWKGRTFRPCYYKGTLYLLNDDGSADMISTKEMLRRASQVAAWLSGKDGRGKLVLDALDDRYFIAELSGEAPLTDSDWQNGAAAISFTCQPFAYSLRENVLSFQTEAAIVKDVSFSVSGNHETLLAFDVTNTSEELIDTITIGTAEMKFAFSQLLLAPEEALRCRYTEDDILLLQIAGADGALRSAMSMRKPESDDDLLLQPGVNSITIETEQACSVKLTARGRWL